LPRTPPAAAIADNANQKGEQIMTIHEYLMKAIQDDARRSGERDRLLLEARRARRARRQRLVPNAAASHHMRDNSCMQLTFRSLTVLSPDEVAITLVDDAGEEVTFLFTGDQTGVTGEPAWDGHYRLVPGPSLPLWPERLAAAALRAVREPLPDAETLALLTAQASKTWNGDGRLARRHAHAASPPSREARTQTRR